MASGNTRQWNGWNFFICFLVSLGQVAFAYPASVISVTLAQPSFLIYMGLLDPETGALSHNANSIIGAMSAVRFLQSHVRSFVDNELFRSSWLAEPSTFTSVGGSPTSMAGNPHFTTVLFWAFWVPV